jgi:hypothetical protein
VTFLELLKSLFALFDQMWVVYVWHGCIVPSKTGNGITPRKAAAKRYSAFEAPPTLT